jgi:hypothetical protein
VFVEALSCGSLTVSSIVGRGVFVENIIVTLAHEQRGCTFSIVLIRTTKTIVAFRADFGIALKRQQFHGAHQDIDMIVGWYSFTLITSTFCSTVFPFCPIPFYLVVGVRFDDDNAAHVDDLWSQSMLSGCQEYGTVLSITTTDACFFVV